MKRLMAAATAGLAGAVLVAGTALAGTTVQLSVSGTYFPPDPEAVFEKSAAEIPAYSIGSKRLFVVNGAADEVDVFDLSDPANPTKIGALTTLGLGNPNSVATNRNLVAIAVEADPKTNPGYVVFYTVSGVYKKTVQVGAQPDMILFSPDGTKVLTANEGEAAEGGTPNPEGSISIVDLVGGVHNATATTLGFTGFNGMKADLQAKGVRFVDPGATVAQDLEPEYIALSEDGTRGWVTLQENNALALIDVNNKTIDDIVGLGTKNHDLVGNALDASDRDGKINIVNWPVNGFYMPDSIASFTANGKTYLITANEGDDRDDFLADEETARVNSLTLDPTAFPDASTLQQNENLGRLTVSTIDGDTDGDGDYDKLYSYGARSFSIWDDKGTLVYDSGDDFERITAAQLPADFNADNAENNSFDNRSDNKGPEPEGLVVGRDNGHTFAFIGLERIGGVMVYNIDQPTAPKFVQYINNRDFAGDAEKGTAGDLGPEGLAFVPAGRSPTGKALLIVANEVSGSTTIYDVNRTPLH
jgi:hypothetical protein